MGWAHGFCEVKMSEADNWNILDATFNCYFDIGVDEIIADFYHPRKVLFFESNELYIDESKEHDEFMSTQVNEQLHTTYKYNIQWFSSMGFYPLVPPILHFHCTDKNGSQTLYDIRADKRIQFV